jgi:hypothetical protein
MPINPCSLASVAKRQALVAEEIESSRGHLIAASGRIGARARMLLEDRLDSLRPYGRMEDEPRPARCEVLHERLVRADPVPTLEASDSGPD